MMRRLFRALFVASLVAPVVSFADEPAPVKRWSVQAQVGASYLSDRSFDFVSDTDPMAVGDIRVGFVPGWVNDHLELDLGYTGGAAGGQSLGVFHADYDIHTLELGLRYRQQFANWFGAYGRVAGLLDFNRLHLTDANEAFHMSQLALTGGLLFNVGAEATLYAWKVLSLGLVFEFGYALRFNQARFNEVTLEKEADQSIKAVPVDVGSLNVSGIQWRLGVAMHF